ncbi:hypothetical protein RB595_009141 [Gaeumannomyces hyphopodioides]
MAVTLPNMQAQQEDLATLFDRNMVLDQKVQPAQQPPQQAQAPQITYSITQHYNHSAHVARQQHQQAQQQNERRFSEPSQSEYPAAEQILASHGVDPSSLSQAQIQLFKEADDDQKRRLVQLWSILPPANSGFNSNSNSNNNNGSALAWSTMMSLDGTAVPVPSQGGDGRWNVADESSDYMMEPYMSSGYEDLARSEYEVSSAAGVPREYRPALDPAYRSAHSPVDWATRRRAMENQYGAFTQCRREA